jgi:predicted nucleotidyltransferase
VLDRFVDLLRHEFGQDLHGVWLYGSRARGEAPGPESDVDLLVVSNRRGPNDGLRLMKLVFEAAEAEGADPVMFAAQLYSPELVEQRRRIRSFFMQEVDRDQDRSLRGTVSPRSEEFMATARERLTLARTALDAGLHGSSASAAYYAMLSAARAAL